MWLVKVKNQLWIDARKIDCIHIGVNGSLYVALTSSPEESINIDSDLVGGFLNHISAINDNHCCQIQDEVEKTIKLKRLIKS